MQVFHRLTDFSFFQAFLLAIFCTLPFTLQIFASLACLKDSYYRIGWQKLGPVICYSEAFHIISFTKKKEYITNHAASHTSLARNHMTVKRRISIKTMHKNKQLSP
jgi:hypothetical protein